MEMNLKLNDVEDDVEIDERAQDDRLCVLEKSMRRLMDALDKRQEEYRAMTGIRYRPFR